MGTQAWIPATQAESVERRKGPISSPWGSTIHCGAGGAYCYALLSCQTRSPPPGKQQGDAAVGGGTVLPGCTDSKVFFLEMGGHGPDCSCFTPIWLSKMEDFCFSPLLSPHLPRKKRGDEARKLESTPTPYTCSLGPSFPKLQGWLHSQAPIWAMGCPLLAPSLLSPGLAWQVSGASGSELTLPHLAIAPLFCLYGQRLSRALSSPRVPGGVEGEGWQAEGSEKGILRI